MPDPGVPLLKRSVGPIARIGCAAESANFGGAPLPSIQTVQ